MSRRPTRPSNDRRQRGESGLAAASGQAPGAGGSPSSANPPPAMLAAGATLLPHADTARTPADRLRALLQRPWRRPRLSGRIVMVSLALLLLVQVAGFSVLRHSLELNAAHQLRDRLGIASRVWERLLDQRAAKLSQGAAVLATDYGFREAVASNDLPTLRSALDNHGQRIGASVVAFLDPQLALRALNDGAGPAWAPALARVAPQLVKLAGNGGQLAVVEGQAYQFVMVPMRAPTVVGWVAMGFPLDTSLVNDMAEISGLHATLVRLSADSAPQVLATSLQPASAALGLALDPSDGQHQLGNEPFLVSTARVATGADGRVSLRLAGSMTAAMAHYRPLELLLSVITVLGLVLFGVGSHWMAQRITEPLRRLVRASERLGRGDYEQPLQTTGRGDEIDELAGAFDHMRINIAAQQQQIRQLAYRDRLTGLPNRVQFRDDVLAAIEHAQARRQQLAVVVVDLDRFKQINDVLGFAFGDRVITAVAQRLQQVVRTEDEVARLGGNSFGLLLRKADIALARHLAHRLAMAFEHPIQLDDQTIDLSAGVGIACWPQHAADVDALISRAEVAMYAAKRRTAGAQVYDSAADTTSAQNLSLLSELRRAIDRNELRLYLQPKLSLATGLVDHAEALVRWQHPQRGLVPPMQFIPFAEQTGFIRQITLWMLGEVARLQPMLQDLGLRRVSVNLSTRDLLDPDLPAKLDNILRAHGAWPDGFCLEITESAIMDDPERAEGTLNRLAKRGFKLSIDDFGTGYSSLAYLKKLPVDELKIDRSFVMAMERNPGDAQIVRSTIDLAHGLGLLVVAEGVENESILNLLRDLRCDEAQGYHLSKPLPVEQYAEWAQSWQERQALGAAAPGTAPASSADGAAAPALAPAAALALADSGELGKLLH